MSTTGPSWPHAGRRERYTRKKPFRSSTPDIAVYFQLLNLASAGMFSDKTIRQPTARHSSPGQPILIRVPGARDLSMRDAGLPTYVLVPYMHVVLL